MRQRRRKIVKLTAASLQTAIGAGGMVASALGLVGQSEPQIVLQLSWAALLFAGIDGLLIAVGDDG